MTKHPPIAVITVAVLSVLALAACGRTEPSTATPVRDLIATIVSENRREATMVARTIDYIEATARAGEAEKRCLENPIECESSEMWEDAVEKCFAWVDEAPYSRRYADCFPRQDDSREPRRPPRR